MEFVSKYDEWLKEWSILKLDPRERWRQDQIMEMAGELGVYFNLLHWHFQQTVVEPARIVGQKRAEEFENEMLKQHSEYVIPEQLVLSSRLFYAGKEEEALNTLYEFF